MRIQIGSIVLATCLALAGCSGGSGGGSNDTTCSCVGRVCGPDGCGGSCGTCVSGQTCDASGHCAGGSSDAVAGFKGARLPLAQGTFWKFGWEYREMSCTGGSVIHVIPICMPSVDNITLNIDDFGVYYMVLGAPKVIDGITAYEVSYYGRLGRSADNLQSGHVAYLALDGSRLLASSDGTSLHVIFDAKTGHCTGCGYWHSFADATAKYPTLALNTWTNTPLAAILERTQGKPRCEVVGGVEYCDASWFYVVTQDFFFPKVGPGAARFYSDMGSMSQYSFNRTEAEITVGLMATSLRGDPPSLFSEVEPNEETTNAQPIGVGQAIAGSIAVGDPCHEDPIGGVTQASFCYTDLYRLDVAQSKTTFLTLSTFGFDPAAAALQLILLDSTREVLALSGPPTERPVTQFRYSFSPGTYYLTLGTGPMPATGAVRYTLQVE
jgi:hypothetical protein